ncbi:polyamine deacetylase HDAC10 isoform X1 [Salmo salar]|uniref:Polyamine deacetylase HDAC10 isoform X1 n=1 Tax=Salmo salar TaxID=8030 RepID=A0A1S3KNP3_SALSA|nr:polyamine deacetylase HDAC10 isoform X1 [Salmo salar]|eukprot:XP_013979959.1 PREDICTED: histone deacetylase 10 isoform X1 [Salmo salar]
MSSGTALVYDEEMTRYKLLWVDPACKIEVPERLTVSHTALQEEGLAERCVSVPIRQATDAEILLAHSEEYLEAVKKTPYMSLDELRTFTQQYGDVYFHPNIYHCAKLAIGATLQLVDSVMTGKVRNGMALVRPPGHHSQRSAANGFCVFNNVAIAAHYAKKQYGIKRVLIVDWDVHHGQGVQFAFEDDPSVLYFSWHRYEHQGFWPNLKESDYDSVGKEKGAGFNINVPWNKVGMENSDYLSVFFHVLLPIAYEFSPDLVFVCAGFDSAIGDPEGHMCATPDIFAHLTHLLKSLAGGKLCAVLEGGYNLTSLAQSVCQTVQTLLGDPAPQTSELNGPCESALESIQCVRSAHKPYWACLKHTVAPPVSEPSTKRCKLAEKEEGVQAEEGQKEEGDGQKAEEEEVVWMKPASRLAPLVHTEVALPADLEVPDRCDRVRSSLAPTLQILQRLRDNFFEGSAEEEALMSLCSVIALFEKMKKQEIRNGLALVPDVSVAMLCAAQHARMSLTNRLLLVYLGDGEIPTYITEDGKALVVQISSKEPEEQKSRYQVSVCLKKGCSDVAGLMQAVLCLLLPLAYEYDPGLVLLVRGPGSGVGKAAWAQITSLLQGLAQGHTLALIQEGEKEAVGTTAASLLGDPAPSLGPLGAPLPEDMEAMERLRQRLQTHWGLLQTEAAKGKEVEEKGQNQD